jgi:hypothetical protein
MRTGPGATLARAPCVKPHLPRAVVAFSLALGLSLAEPPARASEIGVQRNLGVGFAVGTPTSVLLKYHLQRTAAIDLAISFWDYQGCQGETCFGFGYLSAASDYLWQNNLIDGAGRLDWHMGMGGRVSIYDDAYPERVFVSARVPVGLDLAFRKLPFLELFGELAPRVLLYPGLVFGTEAFAGLRFYF